MALLIAMVGLLGTVAIQQTMMNGTVSSRDNGIATRLAMQQIEEFNSRLTLPVTPPAPGPCVLQFDQLAIVATAGVWSGPVWMTEQGAVGAASVVNRFSRRFMVVNQGVNQPYNISVEVSYRIGDKDKVVRIDVERRKCW